VLRHLDAKFRAERSAFEKDAERSHRSFGGPRFDGVKPMSDYPMILTGHEASSMVSTWNEYLVLDRNHDGNAKLEICQYEALAEAECDDDGNELPLPKHINGKEVIGVEDGYIVGGALACYDDRSLIYGPREIKVAIEWLKTKGFKIDNDLIAELQKAVGHVAHD
jgi:hypothetical protein